MQQGVCKWFNESKGYGFINSQGKDYFIHFKEIQGDGYKTLREGDKVNFTPATGDKGMCAKEVSLI